LQIVISNKQGRSVTRCPGPFFVNHESISILIQPKVQKWLLTESRLSPLVSPDMMSP